MSVGTGSRDEDEETQEVADVMADLLQHLLGLLTSPRAT